MRHPIEESPKDGTSIILEDDASGAYDVAHWSTKTAKWVGENGEPTKVTPTHWHRMPRDQYLPREDAKMRNQSRGGRARRIAASSIAVTVVTTALIVTYFHAEVAAYVTRYAGDDDRYITEQVERELTKSAAAAQAMAKAAEPQRRALEEAQARAAALASELDSATKQKQAAEANTAELQKSLQRERDRTEAMARDFATVRRTMDGRVTVGRSADSHVTQVTQKVKTAATETPKAAEAQGSAEAVKLIERASGLLGQGNIGAARIVLERAAESGNARASFMLAETYDPAILSAWGTYGTRGEAAKAREHYAKAHAGGIQEAKGRLDAMRHERNRLLLGQERIEDEQRAKIMLIATARGTGAYSDAFID